MRTFATYQGNVSSTCPGRGITPIESASKVLNLIASCIILRIETEIHLEICERYKVYLF